MTKEITYQTMSREHRTKQPLDKRFALFCASVLRGDREVECDSVKRLGHLGDFTEKNSAEIIGTDHPHPVIIRYYPL